MPFLSENEVKFVNDSHNKFMHHLIITKKAKMEEIREFLKRVDINDKEQLRQSIRIHESKYHMAGKKEPNDEDPNFKPSDPYNKYYLARNIYKKLGYCRDGITTIEEHNKQIKEKERLQKIKDLEISRITRNIDKSDDLMKLLG